MKRISEIQYITQGSSAEEIRREVHLAIESGVDWVQLRMKDDHLDYAEIARSVKESCLGRATFILNDRVQLAQEVDADGVHLGLKDMPIEEARRILGEQKIIGGTANTMADCLNHEQAGADYIGMGPFAFTTTKKELSPMIGLEGFRKLFPKRDAYGWQLPTVNIPIVAIGGIQLKDVQELMEQTTLHGVALSGLIASSQNKVELLKELKTSIYGHIENRG